MKEDIQRIVEDRVNETYKTSIGAQLDYFSAISLVNRYIQTLPTDYFTKPTILWRKNFEPKATEKFTVVLEMPPQSTIRQEIHVSYHQPSSMRIVGILLKMNIVNE